MSSTSQTKSFQTTNQIKGQRKWWALATVMLTMFFSSMDQTVVSTAIPTIIGDLHGFKLYAWIFSAYMLTSSVTIPIYGKLSDVYGRKPFYIFGLVMFAIGSAISGQAHTMLELVLARGVQGIGAGAMMSMPRATIGDIFTPKERGRWMGAIGAVFGVSSILGPAIGGWITDSSLGWRWVFYINLPFAVLAIIGVIFSLPRVRMDNHAKIDWPGALLLVIGLVPILLGFTWAGSKYPWASTQTFSLFIVGLVFLIIFALVERRSKDPILSIQLFKNRTFSMSLILGVFVGMAMFGSLMFLPLFVQGVVGLNAQNSGWVMSPMMISFIAGSVVSGQIMSKTGKYRVLSHFAAVMMIIGLFLFSRMTVDTGYPMVILNMVVLGIGIGSLMPLLNLAVQNAFPYKMMGTVNASQQFVGSLGGVIASPIFGSILNRGFANKLQDSMPKTLSAVADKIKGLSPQQLLTPQAQAQIHQTFLNMKIPGAEKLYQQLIHVVKVSLTHGVHQLFLVGLVFAVLTLIGTFFLPEGNLKGEEYFDEAKQDPLETKE